MVTKKVGNSDLFSNPIKKINIFEHLMTFENLKKGVPCDCLQNTFEDTASMFVRKINKERVKENDFKSKWEKNEELTIDCNKICALKGVSISKIDEESKPALIQNYLEVFPISPKYKPNLYLFKFKEKAGLIKSTPSKNIINHNDFYKCDDFSLMKLEELEIISLGNYV